MTASASNKSTIQNKKIQQHAVLVRHKFTAVLAFTTTIFLLCIENVKSFTAPLSSPALLNENTLMFLATGAHSITKRWRVTGGSTSLKGATSKMAAAFASPPIARAQRQSSTSLKMAFGLGSPVTSPAPQMLDMKTSISAFGGWYNSMDPVARPPVYDDEVTDYSFTSPADSWPSSFDDDAAMPKSFIGMSPARTSSNLDVRKARRPRPIQTLRKIAGWVFRTPAGRNARGFGTQTFL